MTGVYSSESKAQEALEIQLALSARDVSRKREEAARAGRA